MFAKEPKLIAAVLLVGFLSVEAFSSTRVHAQESGFAKGRRAAAFKLPKDKLLPAGVLPGTMVDVICDISKPIKSGIALLNVKVLAIDIMLTGEQTVTVEVIPTQAEVLDLMRKDGILSVKLREAK